MSTRESTSFFTDFYEVTMLQAMMEAGNAFKPAVFDLFARRLPKGRRYGVIAGTARAIEAIKRFRYTDEQLEFLATQPTIKPETVEFLRTYSFKGKVVGLPEGSLYFPNTPVVTVSGTFADCVLLETLLLSIFNHDTAVASAASRMVVAAEGKPLIEMGSRRTSEFSAVFAARAAYIAGFNATSNLEAAMRYGIPTTGTSAHAFTLAFGQDSELDSFVAQMKSLGTDTTLLVDTYNIANGIRNAVRAANILGVAGPGGIRIDSGDFHTEAVAARQLLDSLGATETKIVLSSDIDEYTISEMIDRNTPVDGMGAGTRVVTGSGFPTAEMVYKLVEFDGVPVEKKSEGKSTIGGLKHAYRTYDENGVMAAECFKVGHNVTLGAGEIPTRITLIDGDWFHTENIEEARERHMRQIRSLPAEGTMVLAGQATFTATLMK